MIQATSDLVRAAAAYESLPSPISAASLQL